MNDIRLYGELFWAFFKIGAVTFGGGLAMLPVLDRDLVQAKKWLTEEQLVDYFAIGQSTPGIIAVNVATFVGYNKKGVPGAVVATTGIVFPSLVIIMALAAFLEGFADIPQVQSALRGINVVVAALLIKAVIGLGKKTLAVPAAFFMGAASFILIAVFNVPGVAVVVLSALYGIALKYRRGNEA